MAEWKISCCNPFNKYKHSVRDKRRLRNVTSGMCEKFPSRLQGDKICDACRKQVSCVNVPKASPIISSKESSTESSSSTSPVSST